jgi:hypothetical protein
VREATHWGRAKSSLVPFGVQNFKHVTRSAGTSVNAVYAGGGALFRQLQFSSAVETSRDCDLADPTPHRRGCFGLERLPTPHPWKAPPRHGAHPFRKFAGYAEVIRPSCSSSTYRPSGVAVHSRSFSVPVIPKNERQSERLKELRAER